MTDNVIPDLDFLSDDSSSNSAGSSGTPSSSRSLEGILLTPASSFLSFSSHEDEDDLIRKKKTVTFSPQMIVHCHKIIIGDCPSCPILPLALGWEHADEPETVNLDKYESSLTTKRRRNRYRRGGSNHARKLMYFERTEKLQDVSGYTPKELQHAKQEAIKSQQQQEAQHNEQKLD